ncbi:hypothetical protein ACFXKD_00475 [Nocardiopsis aegyptia]|uniref:hypothetical protein n=1 Tax=Nocardiopsis aegyptia TaxID=220378 RepID=UPI00366EEF31
MSRPREFGPIQLARWLGLTNDQLKRAHNRGLIPSPDIDDRKWSENLAKTLPDRLEQILAELERTDTTCEPSTQNPTPQPATPKKKPNRRNSYGSIQLARLMGLKEWQVRRAAQRGLIPSPDIDDRRWSQAVAEGLPEQAPHIAQVIGDHPGLGSQKAADRLKERTGLDVAREDITELADQGKLSPVGEYMGSALYSLDDLDALPTKEVSTVVEQRHTWITHSLTPTEAADLLGWPVGKFEVIAERHGLKPGNLHRHSRSDVERLKKLENLT